MHNKTRYFVIVLVVIGMVILGIGAVVAIKGRSNNKGMTIANDPDSPVSKWCAARKAWAKEANAVSADIAIKSVSATDKEERAALEKKRDQLSRDYVQRIIDLKVSDPNVIKVEEALAREGSVRANIAVEIGNALAVASSETETDPSERLESLRNAQDELNERVKSRIEEGQRTADQEVSEALARIGSCEGIYRGPLTAKSAGRTPYISWAELEIRREKASAAIEDKIRPLEPIEQYTNQVYHELMRRYRGTLAKCYAKAKGRKPGTNSKIKLQIRLKRNGTVKSVGLFPPVTAGQDVILDCLLESAARWRLPPAVNDGDAVALALDLAAI